MPEPLELPKPWAPLKVRGGWTGTHCAGIGVTAVHGSWLSGSSRAFRIGEMSKISKLLPALDAKNRARLGSVGSSQM